MRVALVSPYSWTTPGGANANIAGLSAALIARGHESRILAPADGDAPGITVVGGTFAVPFNGSIARLSFGPRVAGRIRSALRRIGPDVVHVHEPFAPSASLLATIAARAPLVATFHTSNESAIYRAAAPALRPLWRKIRVKVAVSPAAAETVERVFGDGCRVIPNGVDATRFASVPPPDPGAARILYFGRLERRKGPQVLIEAVSEILAAHPSAEMVIAGDGPLRAELERAVPEAHRSAVRFTGRFGEDERLDLLGSATIVCLPALGGESFGITVAEAMAAGRAVVASSPGYAALIDDGRDGVVVAPGDARALAASLVSLLRAPARAAAMGEAARRSAARFDWSLVAAEVEKAYEDALSEPAR